MKVEKFRLESYSQLGEDLNIERILRSKFGMQEDDKGFYVDVGAFHPYKYSNTYKFYQKGWRGINIEPNPETFHLLEKFRPNDINLNMGVSAEEQVLDYWKYNRGAFNTFSRAESEKLKGLKNLELEQIYKIQTQSLSKILEDHADAFDTIDFLSVDVEGLDLEVLESLDLSRWQPKIICVEENMLAFKRFSDSKIFRYLSRHGYELKCIVAKSNIYIWNPSKNKRDSSFLRSLLNRLNIFR